MTHYHVSFEYESHSNLKEENIFIFFVILLVVKWDWVSVASQMSIADLASLSSLRTLSLSNPFRSLGTLQATLILKRISVHVTDTNSSSFFLGGLVLVFGRHFAHCAASALCKCISGTPSECVMCVWCVCVYEEALRILSLFSSFSFLFLSSATRLCPVCMCVCIMISVVLCPMLRKGWSLVEFLYEFDDDVDGSSSGDSDMDVYPV